MRHWTFLKKINQGGFRFFRLADDTPPRFAVYPCGDSGSNPDLCEFGPYRVDPLRPVVAVGRQFRVPVIIENNEDREEASNIVMEPSEATYLFSLMKDLKLQWGDSEKEKDQFRALMAVQKHDELVAPLQAIEGELGLISKVWVLAVKSHNEEVEFRLFTDEFSAIQCLGICFVNEWVTETDYPDVQNLLDTGDPGDVSKAVSLFFTLCDPSKQSYDLKYVNGPLNKENGCNECSFKGWEIFNEGDSGSPLGMILACDCTTTDGAVDDSIANAKAIIAGYRTMEYDGHHIVITRPGDETPVVGKCKSCEVPHLHTEMFKLEGPPMSAPDYYCPSCFKGVRTAVNEK